MAKKNQADATAELAAAARGVVPAADIGVETPGVTGATSTAAPVDVVSAGGAVADAAGNTDVAVIRAAGAADGTIVIGSSEAPIAVLGVLGEGAIAPELRHPVAPAQGVVKRVQARVLLDGRFGKANTVVTLTEDEAAAAAGEVDTHPAAVAYAKSLAI